METKSKSNGSPSHETPHTALTGTHWQGGGGKEHMRNKGKIGKRTASSGLEWKLRSHQVRTTKKIIK